MVRQLPCEVGQRTAIVLAVPKHDGSNLEFLLCAHDNVRYMYPGMVIHAVNRPGSAIRTYRKKSGRRGRQVTGSA